MNRREADAVPIVLFGTTHYLRHPALESALEAGVTPILPSCVGDMAAFSREMAGKLFRALALPPRPQDPMLQRAAEILTQQYGDRWLAFGCDDYSCEFSAGLSRFGGVATFPKESAQTVLYKDRLRTLWNQVAAEQGHPFMPVRHVLLTFDGFTVSREEILAQMKRYDGWSRGTIIKPNALTSSLEVHRVETFDEGFEVIESVLTTLRENRERVFETQGFVLKPEILVEEAIPRRPEPAEFSVEVLSLHGEHRVLGITEELVDPRTHCELGLTAPASSFPQALHSKVVDIMTTLHQVLKVENCLSHWEFIVTSDERLALVEGHLRAGGGVAFLYKLATDHDPLHVFWQAAMDKGAEIPDLSPSRVAAVRALAPEEPLQRIEEIVSTMSPVGDEQFFIAENRLRAAELWEGPTTVESNLAGVVATGATQEEAEARCSALAASVILRGLDREGARQETRLTVFRP